MRTQNHTSRVFFYRSFKSSQIVMSILNEKSNPSFLKNNYNEMYDLYMNRVMGKDPLKDMRTAKVQASLCIRTVSPEPGSRESPKSLFFFLRSGIFILSFRMRE